MVSRWFKDARVMLPVVVLALLFVGLSGENHAAPEIPLLPPGLPRHVFLGKVPQLYQRNDECGPTSLAMVLRYWNVPETKEQIDDALHWQPGHGVTSGDLTQLATRLGLKVRRYSGNLAELMKNLAQKRPVIVAQWFNERTKQLGGMGHMRVAIGYDYDQRVVFIRDPSPKGSPSLGFEEFLNLWDKSNAKTENNRTRNLMIVITK